MNCGRNEFANRRKRIRKSIGWYLASGNSLRNHYYMVHEFFEVKVVGQKFWLKPLPIPDRPFSACLRKQHDS